MFRLLLTLPLCLWLTLASAVNLDSLWGVWNDNSQPDTNRLKAMHRIAWDGYLFSQPDSAFYFAQMEYDLAEATGNKKGMASALNIQGVTLHFQGNYEKALEYHDKSLKIQEEIGNKKGMAASLSNIGMIYSDQGNYEKALEYYDKSFKIQEEIGNIKGIASSYNNIGNIYKDQGKYEQALEYFDKSLKIKEEIGDKKGMAGPYNNIGLIYSRQGNYEQALEYYDKSLKIAEETGNKKGMYAALNNIGNIYRNQGNYEKALEYFDKSFKIQEELGSKNGMANTLTNIGIIYKEQGNYEQALEYYDKSLKINEETGNKKGISNSLVNIGVICWEQDNYDQALSFGEKALALAQEVGAVVIIRSASNLLDDIYKATAQPAKALEMYELYIEMRDSINSIENAKAIIRQEYKYDYDQKATADSIQNVETLKLKDVQFQTQKTQTNYLILGIITILLVLILVIYNYRTNRIANEALEKQKSIIEYKNMELERLSIVASKTENVIMIMDVDGNLEWVNDSFIKLNNLTMEELIAERGGNIKTISNNPEMSQIFENCKKSNKPYRYDSLNITNEGKRVWESSTLTPIFNEMGVLNKFIIIDTDITKQKDAEELLNQKNKDITDSIRYAENIQQALLPTIESMKKVFLDGFVLFQPKDIVSGDFYWMQHYNNQVYLAVCDCTGHGVPGAFMSMIGSSLLDEAVLEKGITQPNEIFFEVRKGFIKALKQTEEVGSQKDGMDAVLCRWNQNGNLQYAQAYNHLLLIRNGELMETKPDRQPVGFHEDNEKPFTHHELKLNKGDTIYIFSDGYHDQFGGPKGKKFKLSKFKKLLLSIQDKTMNEQKAILEDTMAEWQSDAEQVDDILVMGLQF